MSKAKLLNLHEKNKIVELFENNETQVNIAKKLKRSRETINRFINSAEGKKLIQQREDEIKEEDENNAIEQSKKTLERDLIAKQIAGTITPKELEYLSEILHEETMQGQAEKTAKKILEKRLGKGFADAIYKKIIGNMDLLIKIDSWRAYYEPFAKERDAEFIDFVEQALQYAVDTIRDNEKEKSEKITNEDMIRYAIMFKILNS